ncbi:MAG: hypothetical protein AB7S36_12785 [Planctomycetota bacterium]
MTLYDLQRVMGHASIRTTERHYLGWLPVRIELGLSGVWGVDQIGV